MSIEGINALNGQLKASDSKAAKREQRAGSSEETSRTATSGDTVEVNKSAADELKAKVESIPDVRSEKIEELQVAIDDGTYHVSSQNIATAIMDELV
jgi:flagellar biosynthesis anti-sigma factor FlgM